MSKSEKHHLDLPQSCYKPSIALPVVTPSAIVLVESPFFLQPINNTSSGPKLAQIDEDIPEDSPVFPLTKFPAELQLRVLWHCLVSSLPILDAGIPKDKRVVLIDNETPGQRRINPAIIFTCKAYHHEGIKLLYSNNHFAYTISQQAEVPAKVVRRNLSRIQKLILRPMCTTSIRIRFPSAATTVAMYWLRHSRYLKTLQVDFCGTDVESRYPFDDKDYDSLSMLFETVDNILVQRVLTSNPTNGLSELILAGLPENDVGLSVVRAMSLLVRTDGQIGIGTGKEGARYVLSSKHLDMERPTETLASNRARRREVDPKIHWLRTKDIGDLIERAATDRHFEWLFGDLGLVSTRIT